MSPHFSKEDGSLKVAIHNTAFSGCTTEVLEKAKAAHLIAEAFAKSRGGIKLIEVPDFIEIPVRGSLTGATERIERPACSHPEILRMFPH